MIQRKQTIYLLIAIVCFIACSCMPLGYLVSDGMSPSSAVNSIGVVDGNTGVLSYPFYAIPMFFLALNALESFVIIFMYKNLKSQALNCYIQILAILVECLVSAVLIYTTCMNGNDVTFKPGFAVCLPVVAIVSILFARKGIMSDIKLLRSVDRIR